MAISFTNFCCWYSFCSSSCLTATVCTPSRTPLKTCITQCYISCCPLEHRCVHFRQLTFPKAPVPSSHGVPSGRFATTSWSGVISQSEGSVGSSSIDGWGVKTDSGTVGCNCWPSDLPAKLFKCALSGIAPTESVAESPRYCTSGCSFWRVVLCCSLSATVCLRVAFSFCRATYTRIAARAYSI